MTRFGNHSAPTHPVRWSRPPRSRLRSTPTHQPSSLLCSHYSQHHFFNGKPPTSSSSSFNSTRHLLHTQQSPSRPLQPHTAFISLRPIARHCASTLHRACCHPNITLFPSPPSRFLSHQHGPPTHSTPTKRALVWRTRVNAPTRLWLWPAIPPGHAWVRVWIASLLAFAQCWTFHAAEASRSADARLSIRVASSSVQ